MSRLVLLGTGTGVGKTHVGALLVETWRRLGHPAWGLKPIESGVSDESESAPPVGALQGRGAISSGGANRVEPTDAQRLWGDATRPAALAWHHRALRAPISPHLAARQEGVELDLAATLEWVRQAESHLVTLHDHTPDALSLIETAGGAFTPLSATLTCADLAQALAPAFVVVVAPDALGVLHDVGATLRALRAVGCPVHALVLSESRPADASTGSNAGELERVVFPTLGSAAPACTQVFRVGRGAAGVESLLAAWAAFAADAPSRRDG